MRDALRTVRCAVLLPCVSSADVGYGRHRHGSGRFGRTRRDATTERWRCANADPEVQREFLEIVSRSAGREVRMGSLPRFEFYERVRGAYAVVATSEARPYGCFLVTAGVI